MATVNEILSLAAVRLRQVEREHRNLNRDVSIRYALIDALLEKTTGRRAPKIISGFRTRAENNRVGGAPQSWHLHGRAIDLDPADDQALQEFAAWWELTGGRWGGRFLHRGRPDVNHFDVPGPFRPAPSR